jgi:hypothetical protein
MSREFIICSRGFSSAKEIRLKESKSPETCREGVMVRYRVIGYPMDNWLMDICEYLRIHIREVEMLWVPCQAWA